MVPATVICGSTTFRPEKKKSRVYKELEESKRKYRDELFGTGITQAVGAPIGGGWVSDRRRMGVISMPDGCQIDVVFDTTQSTKTRALYVDMSSVEAWSVCMGVGWMSNGCRMDVE